MDDLSFIIGTVGFALTILAGAAGVWGVAVLGGLLFLCGIVLQGLV